MARYHDRKRKPGRVSEPVQVYLAQEDRATLQRLAEQLGLSMSDVIRRALSVLEQNVMDPKNHPALRLIGVIDSPDMTPLPYDPAAEHDRFLADVADPPVAPVAPTARKRRGR
jgi:hypothetical protein